MPPFHHGALRVDSQGRLWVGLLPFPDLTGGDVYDVIDSHGVLIDRVKLPVGTFLLGFGTNDAVYLRLRNGNTVSVARARFRTP
jgi:hypothetical protein